MTDIAKKTKIRGGHKAHLTKLLKAATCILNAFDMEKENELLGYREALISKSEVLAKLDDEILLSTEDEEISDMTAFLIFLKNKEYIYIMKRSQDPTCNFIL